MYCHICQLELRLVVYLTDMSQSLWWAQCGAVSPPAGPVPGAIPAPCCQVFILYPATAFMWVCRLSLCLSLFLSLSLTHILCTLCHDNTGTTQPLTDCLADIYQTVQATALHTCISHKDLWVCRNRGFGFTQIHFRSVQRHSSELHIDASDPPQTKKCF